VTAELKLVEGGYSLEEGVGTKQWGARVRRRAKDLSAQLETAYMELGRILYQVYDVPINGDPKNGPIFKQWGYESFQQYAEVELNLKRRKAEHLRSIFYRLEVELAGMNPALKQQIINLGWCKVRELVRVLTLRNAAEWLERAKVCSYPELVEAIARYRQEYSNMPEDLDNKDAEPLVPPIEKLHPEVFQLYTDQRDNVHKALERSMELSGSNKKSHNLDLICMDFLATNEFTKAGPEQKAKYLAKIEQLLNVRIVAMDPRSGEIVHGLDNLEELVQGVSDDHSNEGSTSG